MLKGLCQLVVLPFAAALWLAMYVLRTVMILLALVCTLGLAAPFLLRRE